MNDDHQRYYKFTGPARLEKAVNSILGLIEGVAIDGVINETEIGFIRSWLNENRELEKSHPFNEFMPVVEAAIADGVLTEDERLNIKWLCERLKSSAYFDVVTADIQRLHALLAGIAADCEITEKELRGLSDWLSDHEHLKTCWPYEEVGNHVSRVLGDRNLDPGERQLLQNFFSEFVTISDNRTIVNPQVAQGQSIVGLCTICPDMAFDGKRFGFTGSSSKYTRNQFVEIVESLGGTVAGSISKKLDYLIIGADGNPCWAYACYGRKVEMAVALRREGARILLIHENDFHDAVADYR